MVTLNWNFVTWATIRGQLACDPLGAEKWNRAHRNHRKYRAFCKGETDVLELEL
jgi:hypothetical protein